MVRSLITLGIINQRIAESKRLTPKNCFKQIEARPRVSFENKKSPPYHFVAILYIKLTFRGHAMRLPEFAYLVLPEKLIGQLYKTNKQNQTAVGLASEFFSDVLKYLNHDLSKMPGTYRTVYYSLDQANQQVEEVNAKPVFLAVSIPEDMRESHSHEGRFEVKDLLSVYYHEQAFHQGSHLLHEPSKAALWQHGTAFDVLLNPDAEYVHNASNDNTMKHYSLPMVRTLEFKEAVSMIRKGEKRALDFTPPVPKAP